VSPEGSGSQGANEFWLGSADYQANSNQEYDGYVADQNEPPGDDIPDIALDVPVLKVDEIDLEVDDLRAHISLRAELADLVNINVGVDAYLDNVKLNVKGAEAQAILRLRSQRILDTLDRVLETINRNPQILSGASGGGVDPTDAAKRKADELGVDLSEVRGTGFGGRVVVKDVKRAAKQSQGSAQNQTPAV
jgi:hypothetical protein